MKTDPATRLVTHLKERVQYFLRNGTQVRSNIVFGIFLKEENCFQMQELDGEKIIELLIPLENVKEFRKSYISKD